MASLPSVRGTFDLVVVPGRVALDVARRVERLLVSIEELGAGVASMEREFKGLRKDMREVVDGVERLRQDVQELNGGVGGIRGATESIEGRIDDVAQSLKHVDAITARLSRFGTRRPPRPGEKPAA